MTGVAFTTGALSNAYFSLHGSPFKGRVIKTVNAEKGHVLLQLMKTNDAGVWLDIVDEKLPAGTNTVTRPPTREASGKWVPVAKTTNERGAVIEGKVVPAVLDPKQAEVVPESSASPRVVQGRSISIVYAKANPDNIIPTYIKSALPGWFNLVFLLTLLAAAMSTLSSQLHTLGTAAGRDVFEQLAGSTTDTASKRTVHIVRMAIIVGLLLAVTFGNYARGGYIIARATAIFFGLCASTFLPAFVGGLFFRRITKAGTIASMIVGFSVTAFWLLFVKTAEAGAIGLVQKLTGGKSSILADAPNWPVVDPLFVALPLSALAAVVVSLLTRPPDAAHLAKCFGKEKY
jgi:SSS family solute:Na+ symporter